MVAMFCVSVSHLSLFHLLRFPCKRWLEKNDPTYSPNGGYQNWWSTMVESIKNHQENKFKKDPPTSNELSPNKNHPNGPRISPVGKPLPFMKNTSPTETCCIFDWSRMMHSLLPREVGEISPLRGSWLMPGKDGSQRKGRNWDFQTTYAPST